MPFSSGLIELAWSRELQQFGAVVRGTGYKPPAESCHITSVKVIVSDVWLLFLWCSEPMLSGAAQAEPLLARACAEFRRSSMAISTPA